MGWPAHSIEDEPLSNIASQPLPTSRAGGRHPQISTPPDNPITQRAHTPARTADLWSASDLTASGGPLTLWVGTVVGASSPDRGHVTRNPANELAGP